MDEETKKIYSAFGYDVSKGLRRPNQVTDEEALTIAKIFNNQLQWEVYLREKGENGQIGLKSNPEPIQVMHSFGNGSHMSEREETIYLRKNSVVPPTFYKENISLVNQYLISIGVERKILTPSKLEGMTSGKIKTGK